MEEDPIPSRSPSTPGRHRWTARPALGRRRRSVRAFGLLVAVVAGAVGSPVGAAPVVETFRFGGVDRYDSARAIAVGAHDGSEGRVAVVASGEGFPDALAASYLAGGVVGPVFLTGRDQLPQATRDGLAAVKAETVVLLGGEAAVSASVEAELAATGEVLRYQGADRYATAADIARAFPADTVGTIGGRRTAIVTSGRGFTDALAAGPLAFAQGYPVLLTDPQELPEVSTRALDDLGIELVVVVGGEAVVSDRVVQQLLGRGGEVRRLAGANRRATAAAVADFAVDELAFTADVGLVSGADFPDALAASAHAGRYGEVLLLTAGPGALGTETEAWLRARGPAVNLVEAFGGTSAVSDATLAEACRAAGGSCP